MNFLHQSKDKGFTIMEVMISLGIFLILLGLTTPFVLQFYNRYQLDAERTTFIALLRQARAMSLTGENGATHGVYLASSQFTIFEGVSYATRDTSIDQTFERNSSVDITGPSETLFRYLTGTSASQSFNLTNGTKQGIIYVNKEGSIDWE